MHAVTLRAAIALLALASHSCDFGYKINDYPDATPRPPDARPPDANPNAADGAPDACPNNEVQVRIAGLEFMPKHLTVTAGTRVTWINQDTMDHDVTQGDPGDFMSMFASGNLRPGDQWSYDFCTPVGKVVYHCAAHPNVMRDATVTVEAP